MATIKTSDTRVVVDDLASQFVDLLRTGTEAAEPFRVITDYLAQSGVASDKQVSQTIEYPLADAPHTTTYTLAGTKLQDSELASATKLVDQTLETESSYEDGMDYETVTKTVDTWTIQANPYDPNQLQVTNYSATANGTLAAAGSGTTAKGTVSGTVKFVGVEQYVANDDGDLVLQNLLIKSAAYTAKSTQSGTSYGVKFTGSAVDNVSLVSKSGLTYDATTGTFTGVLDSLTYNYGYSLKAPGYASETYADSYSTTTFTAAMLQAVADAVQFESVALHKAAILGGDDTITGNSKEVNYLEGGLGNDRITGNSGADTLYGDEGDDLLFGLAGNDVLYGGEGDDVLDGGAGVDSMNGGEGDDTYIIDNAAELFWVNNANNDFQSDFGIDTLRITYKGGTVLNPSVIDMENLPSLVENLQLTGTGVFRVFGNTLSNVLDAGKTASTLIGGLGDDVYYLGVKGATAVEEADEGIDSIFSALTHVLGANFENLTLTGKAALNGTGNAVDNAITGNDGANILDGGAGADSLQGGKGNDTYIVDTVGDVVTEALNAGTDTVKSSVSFTLGANVENLTLTGLAQDNIFGVGNDLKNTLTGDAGNNLLDGRAGVDKLVGGEGNDTYLVDLIVKGSGAKATAALEDSITEKKGEGDHDTLILRASLDTHTKLDAATKATTVTLASYLENLDASQTDDLKLNLTGNAANNVITGNDADNLIIGGLGADTLIGNGGTDTFSFTSLKDLGLNATQDVIQDFTSGEDLLSFKGFKGWTFSDTATAATGTKQLWAVFDGTDTTVFGNSGGGLEADFSIKLQGTTLASTDVVFV